MIKKTQIILILVFIALLQLQIYNPCRQDEPFSAGRTGAWSGLISGIEAYKPAVPEHVYAYTPPDRNKNIFEHNSARTVGRYSENLLPADILPSVTDIIGKEIDLKFATFRPDKLTLKIMLAPSLKLWWIGYIPGAYRSENSFGLTYSGAFSFYPADTVPGSLKISDDTSSTKTSATPE